VVDIKVVSGKSEGGTVRLRMMPNVLRLRTALATALCAAALVLPAIIVSACGAPAPMHGTMLSDPQPAPPLVLTGADGKRFDLAAEKGKIVLLYFGYTHCPDACPTMLSDWAKVRRLLGADTTRVRFVFATVDPDRDTPPIAAAYAQKFDAAILGFAVGRPAIDTVRQAWGFAVFKEFLPSMPAGTYGVIHPGQAFVVYPDGKLTMIYPPNTKPADIAADLKRIK